MMVDNFSFDFVEEGDERIDANLAADFIVGLNFVHLA